MHNNLFDSEHETLEDLGRREFRLIQSKAGFRYGEDTVLLSHFVSKELSCKGKGVIALELGANCGAASILLSSRCKDLKIDAVEILPVAYSLLERNICMNGLENVIRPIFRDIRDLPDHSQVRKSHYDLVFFNPPYQIPGRGRMKADESEAAENKQSRVELNGSLKDFIWVASETLRPQGIMTMVHRAVRLPEVIYLMQNNGIEPSLLKMIYPMECRNATAFLISGRKGRKPGGFIVDKPLILRDQDGCLCRELTEIYSEES